MNIEDLSNAENLKPLEADEFAVILQGAIESGKVAIDSLESLANAMQELAGATAGARGK